MRNIMMTAAAIAVLGSPSIAQASSLGRPCTTAPQSQWLPLDALKAKAEAQGYKVQKAKIAKACGEIYALDPEQRPHRAVRRPHLGRDRREGMTP